MVTIDGPPFNTPMEIWGKNPTTKKRKIGDLDALVLTPTLNVPEMLCNFGMLSLFFTTFLGDAEIFPFCPSTTECALGS